LLHLCSHPEFYPILFVNASYPASCIPSYVINSPGLCNTSNFSAHRAVSSTSWVFISYLFIITPTSYVYNLFYLMADFGYFHVNIADLLLFLYIEHSQSLQLVFWYVQLPFSPLSNPL